MFDYLSTVLPKVSLSMSDPTITLTGVFGKPYRQFFKNFGKGRETGLFALGETIGVGNFDTGIDQSFVDIKPTSVFTKDFK